jgi:iron(III) transport system substrate-binding protein
LSTICKNGSLTLISAVSTFAIAGLQSVSVKDEFARSAKNRDRILAEWSTRYDGRSEPQ